MNSNLIKLEFNKILDILSVYCITYIGKDLCKNIVPLYVTENVKNLQKQTSEAYSLITKYGNPPINEIGNITPYIKNLESFTSLSPKALLEVANILNVSYKLKTYYHESDVYKQLNFNKSSRVSELDDEFELLYSNPGIYENITHAIIDENNIADDASKALNSMRRNRRRLESSIKEKLNSFIHSSSYSKYIMEPIITIRNDRYVIPVKIEYKENINGLIHDISASGSTVYVEPTSVFELNNQINNIKLEENIEIEKILEELSKQLYPITSNLKETVDIIGNIDLIFAKAKYSMAIDGVEPIINSDKYIDLKGARHPLIAPNAVVPIDINLGKSFSSLIITGPNTGGKTVTLKTVGLLCLMAYSGLHVPVKENSSIYVFDGVFADIGDEQSIQESLSTFSSHMKNIIEILEKSTDNSLILIDELGSGTDPIQGANLAISILEYFHNKGALSLSTTHYSELKHYALVTNGFENASSEFDIENLRPTYKILIGVPGKSNAFAISKKLGLPNEILERAENLLSDDNISVEELIKNIYDDKLAIEKEKEKIIKNSNQVEMLRKQLETDVSDVEQQRTELISKAKMEARNILISAKEDANDIIKELNNLYSSTADKNSLKKANELRDNLNGAIQNNLEDNMSSTSNDDGKLLDVTVGLEVLVKPFNMVGTILTLPNKNNEVMVQFGSTKTNIKVENLELVQNSNSNASSKSRNSNSGFSSRGNLDSRSRFSSMSNLNSSSGYSKNSNTFATNSTHKVTGKHNSSSGKTKSDNYMSVNSNFSSMLKAKSVSTEINVIGETVEDAIFVIDKYLDDCYLANLPSVRIVHGKGTGKLRTGIHAFLKKNPRVKSFRLGTFGEGEMGVTIVELKNK